MSDSVSKSRLNRDTVQDNETIFDFLKRKKQYNLENTVNKSLHQHSYSKRKVDIDLEDDFPQTKDISKYNTYDHTNKYTRTPQQTITPKKIQFQETRGNYKSQAKETAQTHANPAPARTGKSFLAMISPIKNRASSALEERKEEKQNYNQNQTRSGTKGGKVDNFSRKNVTKCINSIKETVNYLNDNIKNIKDKSHGLTVLFNPVFNHLSDSTHPAARQIGDLKNKLRSFQALINGISPPNCDELLQNFHRNLEEHLQGEEGVIRKDLQRAKHQQLQSLNNSKQNLIQKLQQQIRKINKENQLLNRRLQKIENNKGEIEEAVSERQVNYVQQMERMRGNFEIAIQQLKAKNEQLQIKYDDSNERLKQAEKDYKNQRMVKESLQNKYRQEIQQITQVKDAYLLNQIMVLKTEFNADMARVNELHKIKEAELVARIQKKDEEITKKQFERGCDKQIESKIMVQANQIKQENLQLKAKSQCIVTDMYRMNEELYQHWMALKDIKLLATRLGAFPQYRKIYEDLAFNDHLFY